MTFAMTMTSNLARLEEIKKDIRSLLVSRNSRDVTVSKLNKMYKDVVDEDIPFKDFNYTSLQTFLSSIPDVLHLRHNKANQMCAYHIDTEKSQHISSLVAREKQQPDFIKSRSRLLYRDNLIDPHILNEVLEEFINSSTRKKEKIVISKTDVLSAVINHIGVYTFYTIRNLNSQLNELTHILIHDDKHIYIKDTLLLNIKKKKEIQKSVTQKPTASDDFSLQKTEIENTKNSMDSNVQVTKTSKISSVGNLIKESTKIRLQKLIEKHVEGIWCSDLPRVYQREYGVDLEYSDLGFNSIPEFVAALPDILQIVEPLNAKRPMILDARINVSLNQETLSLHSFKKYSKNIINDSQTISTKLLSKVCKSLIPKDVIGFNETVDQIRIGSLFMDPNNSIHVVVSEVHNPSFFWVTLFRNRKKIIKLINTLQDSYNQDFDNYRIPHVLLRPGLHVACVFEEMWHRGIIKKFKPDGSVVVHFYDYGTNSTFDPNLLYFLSKKFSTVPAQAIPCSLHNVKPIKTNKWSIKVSKNFAKEVFDKPFKAYIMSVDEKNNSMVINLKGRSSDLNEVYLNQWMVAKKKAVWGLFFCKINNIAFNHHQQCWQMNEENIDCKY